MKNPFVEMERYTTEALDAMTKEELIGVQRSVLLPHEVETFDSGGFITLKSGDGRSEFLDYTDALIVDREIGA